MNALTRDDARRQTVGGVASLYAALALISAMPFFLLVVDYASATTTAEKVAVIVADYGSIYAMYLASYVFYGLAVGVLAFTLYDILHEHAPVTTRLATAVGLLWSAALVASGMVWNHGMTTVVGLAKTSPAQAQVVWQSVEPVSEALGGAGGELLGGLWILLLSVAALRGGALPKPLAWFGIAIGGVGLASVLPPLHDGVILFGLATIVWFLWLGITLFRRKAVAKAERLVPAEAM